MTLIASRAAHVSLLGRLGTCVLMSMAMTGCAAPELVSFPTDDGGIVYADQYGKGKNGLILAHGGRFNKESWSRQAPVFAEAGFRVLAIDFRGRGQSEGGTAGEWEGVHYDVLAAIRFLRETGAESVSIVGGSFGGWAAANASAMAPGEVQRLVLLATPVDHPEKLTGRKLFILTRDDFRGEGIPRLPEIRADFEMTPEPRELLILEGSAHAQFIFETDQADRLMNEILRFLTAP